MICPVLKREGEFMRILLSAVLTLMLMLSFAGTSSAGYSPKVTSSRGVTKYVFTPPSSRNHAGDLQDLEHKYAYRWEIDWKVPEGQEIAGIQLKFKSIRNWNNDDNILYVNLLDLNGKPANGNHVTEIRDRDGYTNSTNAFAGNKGILLDEYDNILDKSNGYRNLTYDFSTGKTTGFKPGLSSDGTASNIDPWKTFENYVADGLFGFGFDPDCHFWNKGISLEIKTKAAAAPVPEPSTIALLGVGMIGIVGYGRKKRKA
jgi:hypothetical protein